MRIKAVVIAALILAGFSTTALVLPTIEARRGSSTNTRINTHFCRCWCFVVLERVIWPDGGCER